LNLDSQDCWIGWISIKIIREMLAEDLIEYTIPDKPKSRLQKYRLTKRKGGS